MIKDKLENSDVYSGISQNLKTAFDWLKTADLSRICDGKHVIDGDKIYANVQTYETKEDALYEAHRKYIDVQYIISGNEKIGVTDYKSCKTFEEYDDKKDIEFLKNNRKEEYQILSEGEFLVLFPHDAHKPSINLYGKSKVKKVVVKVQI